MSVERSRNLPTKYNKVVGWFRSEASTLGSANLWLAAWRQFTMTEVPASGTVGLVVIQADESEGKTFGRAVEEAIVLFEQ